MAVWNRTLEAWGDDALPPSAQTSIAGPREGTVEAGGRGIADAASAERRAQQLLPQVLRPGAAAASSWGAVPTLRALCLAFLGRHITELVAQIGPHLGPLPADIKACLLCVARRRGLLGNRVLLALADEGWTLLDLAGAASLSERAVRQALLRCPRLRALDLRSLPNLTPGLLRQLPELVPSLGLLALGGSRAQEDAALEALPDILPHVRVHEQSAGAVQDSWEEAIADDGVALPDPGVPCGLQRLALLVWPQAPAVVHHTVHRVSPTVTLLDQLPTQQQHQAAGRGGTGAGAGACRVSGAWPQGHSGGGGGVPCWRGPDGLGGSGLLEGSARACSAGAGAAERAGASGSLGSAAAPPGAASSPQPGIRVLHARDARREGATSASAPSGGGSCGRGGGGARYTAPHLRQQRQRQGMGERPSERGGEPHEPSLRPNDQVQRAEQQQQQQQQQEPPRQQEPQPQPQRGPDGSPHGPPKGRQAAAAPGSSPPSGNEPLPPPAPPQLDDCLAALVAEAAWRDPGAGAQADGAAAFESLHIAEKFRLAYEQQDARLRARAAREAAWEARREMRASGAARELARWLDQE